MLYLGENNYDVYLGDSFATIYCGEEIVYPTTITGISITKKAEINPTGGTKQLTIRSESAWTLSKNSSDTWLTLSADSGDSGVSKVTINVDANTGSTDLVTVLTAQTTNLQYSAVCTITSCGGILWNTIVYTTTDGQTAGFANTNFWGDGGRLTVVSNEYNNGKGVITFNGDLTGIRGTSTVTSLNVETITLPRKLSYVNDYGLRNLQNCTAITFESDVIEWLGHEALDQCAAKHLHIKKLNGVGMWAFRGGRYTITIDDASGLKYFNSYSSTGQTGGYNSQNYAWWQGFGCDNPDYKTEGVTLNGAIRMPGFGQSLAVNYVPMGSVSLTHQGWVDFFNDLATVNTFMNIEMFKKDFEKLTAEEVAIATNKGWTISTTTNQTGRPDYS